MTLETKLDGIVPMTMEGWFPVYQALATLELDDANVRKAKSTISYLNKLGLQSNSLEAYWQRVEFIAKNAYGNVLEIGCATGNITRYISKNNNVKRVSAVDILPNYVDFLRRQDFDKVDVFLSNLISEPLRVDYKIDCVVMSELIEHITTSNEIGLLGHLQGHLNPRAQFVITTPIGFMKDPTHIRGFSYISCVLHLFWLYGRILKKSDNGIQQFYVVQYQNRSFVWRPYELMKRIRRNV